MGGWVSFDVIDTFIGFLPTKLDRADAGNSRVGGPVLRLLWAYRRSADGLADAQRCRHSATQVARAWPGEVACAGSPSTWAA